MKKVIETPEHRARLEQLALEPRYLDPAAYRQLWTETEARMTPLLQSIQPK
jgi:tripartite-type tricarboxylate transporter receptor subunit TctC